MADDLFLDVTRRRQRWCERYQDSNTLAWTHTRDLYMNATDTPSILGFGSHSAGMLWDIKKGFKPKPIVPAHIQEIFDRGHADEPLLVEELLRTLPAERYTCFPVGRCISTRDKRIAATPDRLLWDHRRMEWYGIECKSRQNYNQARIPTLANYVQMQQQMWCADTRKTFYICNNVVDGPAAAVHCVVMFYPDAWAYIYNEIDDFFEMMLDEVRPGRNQTDVHRDEMLHHYSKSVFYRTAEGQYLRVTSIPSDK